MKLYRVLLGDAFSHLSADKIEDITVWPNVPYHTMADEENKTERICMSESIEGCLTSIGWNRLDIAFQDYLIGGIRSVNMELINDVVINKAYDGLRVVILTFDTDNLDRKYLISPEELDEKNYVPDAYITREWWYLLPIKPKSFEIRYLLNYDMNDIEYILPKELRNRELTEEEAEEYIEQGIEISQIKYLLWEEEALCCA